MIEDGNSQSPAVLELFDSAEQLMASNKTNDARRVYAEADRLAREHGLLFLSALVNNQQALTFYGDASIVALKETAELSARGLAASRDRLLEMRAPRAVAAKVLDPQEELREVILANLEQFELAKESRYFQARLRFIEDLLGEHAYERAEYYSQSTLEDAHKQLGKRHWWAAILLLRLARSQTRLRKFDEAFVNLDTAGTILLDWCLESDDPLTAEISELRSIRSEALNPLP